MNVGTICYATQSGLGHLGKMFFDNGIINRIMVHPHPRYESFADKWYSKEVRYDVRQSRQFLDGLDVLILFENAFNQWNTVKQAQGKGIKIVIVPMYEWTPNPLPIEPNLVICPSDLDVSYFDKYNWVRINIPAPNEVDIPWKERTKAIQFVHNAGHGQVGYAKGTPEVLEAFNYTKSNARLLVRGQYNEPRIKELFDKYQKHPKIDILYGDVSYNELFSIGDVYINAERYNGLSLPLQEAFSAGMLVMTTNRFPANTWLPNAPLIPVNKYENFKVSQTWLERSEVKPIDIAHKVDEWYNKDIEVYSRLGKKWAEDNNWKNLKSDYSKAIESLLR
jgi:hypothetical protein